MNKKIRVQVKKFKLFLLRKRLRKIIQSIDNYYAKEIELGITTSEQSKKRVLKIMKFEREFTSRILTLENAGILPKGFLRSINKTSKK